MFDIKAELLKGHEPRKWLLVLKRSSTSQAFLVRRYRGSFRKIPELTTIGNWLSTGTSWWGPSSIIYPRQEVEDGCGIEPVGNVLYMIRKRIQINI